jgi:hypothetical protein
MSKLITIKTYSNRIEAEADKELLRNEGVKSVIFADDCGGMRPHMTFVSGVELVISEKDIDRACEILQIYPVK